ncbi:ATP-binding protein [Paenibacillus thiaminolyticus]|uniref:ATP-binding protein n=1 Tax=Paenibacillus thiaminolyticus TaxID=49283 RepID=UPI003D266A15
MMSLRKLIVIIVLVVLSLSGIRLAFIALLSDASGLSPVQGLLDLRGQDVDSMRTIPLNGEWEFIPGALLTDDYRGAASSDDEPSYVHVPGSWKPVTGSASGYGSYRLRILMSPVQERSFAIRVQGMLSSSALYVNGKLLANAGWPGPNEAQTVSRDVPYSGYFVSGGGEIEIVIQVANYFDGADGGILRPLYFGTAESVNKASSISIGSQLVVCIVLIMHFIYAVVLFCIGVRDKSLFYFSMLILSAIFATLADDDKLLLDWLQLDYGWNIRLLNISLLLVAGFMLQFVKCILPEGAGARWFRGHAVLSAASVAIIWLAPPKFTLEAMPVFDILLFIPFLVMPILIIWVVRRKESDSIYLLIAATALTGNMIWGFIKNTMWKELGYYPLDFIVTFLAFATFWFKRFYRTSAQMADVNTQLIKADKVKDDFLANTSHELRTPLHGIINMAQSVLENQSSLKEANRKNLKLIVSVGRRMSHLLNDLLDVSQLKQEKLRLKLDRVVVQPVANSVVEMLSFMTEGKPIRVAVNIPKELPPVIADEERLTQILFNLLHNAIKYTDEGIVMIDAYVRKGYVHIRVSDTGRGMDEATKRRAFQAYEQGEASASVGGIGLGLSITKQLVELHGGTLKADSQEGAGSVFTFTIPLAPSASAAGKRVELKPALLGSQGIQPADSPELPALAVHASLTEIAAAADNIKILAVDDDPVNLNILTNLLIAEGYSVTTAMSGREAAVLVAKERWDLVIADVMTPHMSGYELTRAIRERFSMSELPILLLTARSRAEDIDSGFRAGANDYVTKPVDALELKSRVRALTDLRRSIAELLRMEAAYLQAQIKPHFLFNTLNSIVALSKLDTVKMRTLIESFSKYLRLSFDQWNAEHLVPLEHELDLVRAYLTIEKTRFGDRLDVIWDVTSGLHAELPPLTIQPLVENALRHGILSRSQGGMIHIRVAAEENGTRIIVADDGAGMDPHTAEQVLYRDKPPHGGIGLLNTDKRLRKLYGEGLNIQSVVGEGTTVSFFIPKKNNVPRRT